MNKYIEDYRNLSVFKVKYQFTKNWQDEPWSPDTRYFIAFDIPGAIKECTQQFCRGDRKYCKVLSVIELGFPHGIHHLT